MGLLGGGGGDDAATSTSGWGVLPPIQNNGNDWGSSPSANSSSAATMASTAANGSTTTTTTHNSAVAAAAAAAAAAASSSVSQNNPASASSGSSVSSSNWLSTSSVSSTAAPANVIVANNNNNNNNNSQASTTALPASASIVSSSPKPTSSWAQAAGKGLLNSSSTSGATTAFSSPSIASVVAGSGGGKDAGAADSSTSILAGTISQTGAGQDNSTTIASSSSLQVASSSGYNNNQTYSGSGESNHSSGGYGKRHYSMASMPSTAEMINSISEEFRETLLTEKWSSTVIQDSPWNLPPSPPPSSKEAVQLSSNPAGENTWKPTKSSGTEIWEVSARQKKTPVGGVGGGNGGGGGGAAGVANPLLGSSMAGPNNVLGSLGPAGAATAMSAMGGGSSASGQSWGNGPASHIGGTWGDEDDDNAANHWTGVPSINAPGASVAQLNNWPAAPANPGLVDMANGLGAPANNGAAPPNNWNQMDMLNGMGGAAASNKMSNLSIKPAGWSSFCDYPDSAANPLIAGNAVDECVGGVSMGPIGSAVGNPNGNVGPANWNKMPGENSSFGTWNAEKKEQVWDKTDNSGANNGGGVDDGTSAWGNCRPSRVSNWKDDAKANNGKNGFHSWNGNVGPVGGNPNNAHVAANPSGSAAAAAAGGNGGNKSILGRSWNEPGSNGSGGAKPAGMWNNGGEDALKGMNNGNTASWVDQQANVNNASLPLWSNDANKMMAGGGLGPGGNGKPLGAAGSGSMTPNNWADGQVDTSGWGAMKQSKPLVRDLILASRQYRVLLNAGFKKEDVETALRNNNMRYDETYNELQRNANNLIPFDDMRAKDPMNVSALSQMNKMRGPMRNQTMEGAGQLQNENPINQLFTRIQHAVADGYLNSQILNQQLSHHNLAIIYQLLQQVRNLQTFQNSGSNMGKTAAQIKAQIALLQSQLQLGPSNGNGGGGGMPPANGGAAAAGKLAMPTYFKPGPSDEAFNESESVFDFSNSNASMSGNNGQQQQQQPPLTSRLSAWKSSKPLSGLDATSAPFNPAPGGMMKNSTGGWSSGGMVANESGAAEIWPNMGSAEAFMPNALESFDSVVGLGGGGPQGGLLDDQGFGGFMKDSASMYSSAWSNGCVGPAGGVAEGAKPGNESIDSFGLSAQNNTWSFNNGAGGVAVPGGSPIKKQGNTSSWNNVAITSDSFLAASGDLMWSAATAAGNGAGGSKSRPPPGLSKNGSHSAGTVEPASIWSSALSPTGGVGSEYIRIRNLNPQIYPSALRYLCMQHGSLQWFNQFSEHALALARYRSRDQALKAQAALNNFNFHGSALAVDCPSETEVQQLEAMLKQSKPGMSGTNPSGNWSNGGGNNSSQQQPQQAFHRSNTIGGGIVSAYGSAGGASVSSGLSMHTSSPALTPYSGAGGGASSVFSGGANGGGGNRLDISPNTTNATGGGGWSSATGASGLWETGGAGSPSGTSLWSSASGGFSNDRATPIQNYLLNDLLAGENN